MKKYRISRYYASICIGGFCFSLFATVFLIWCYCHTEEDIEGFVYWFIFLFLFPGVGTCVVFLYLGISQFVFSSFCVDEKGITMNVAFKKYYHPWEKLADLGFIYVYINKGGLYWLYFSERLLSPNERRWFLKSVRHALNSVAYFQYDEKTLQEILPCMPESIAEKLREEEKIVKEKMTWLEKKYH